MFSENDALAAAKNLYNAVGYVHRRVAQLGRAADGVINAGDGFVYLRPQEGGETRAKNAGVVSAFVPDAWVEIGENTRTGELEVIRVATEMLYTHGTNLTSRAATSDVDPGHFAGIIPADALQDLKVRPPDAVVGGLNVCIEGGWTEYGYSYKQHQSVSAYLPSTPGTRWWVACYLDDANTVQFSTAFSTEMTIAADVMALIIGSIPTEAVPDGAYPLYAFILEEGQTEVTAANTVFRDIRLHYARTPITLTVPDIPDLSALYQPITAATVNTTNATVTTLATIATASNISYVVQATVAARRTGGASGSAGDSAGYILAATFKNIAGTVTQVGSTSVLHSSEDQAGWDCAFDISGTSVRVRVTGAASNNVTWVSNVVVTSV